MSRRPPSTRCPTRSPEAAALAATGTDGHHINERFALPLPYAGDSSGQNLSAPGRSDGGGVAGAGSDGPTLMNSGPLENKAPDAPGRVLAGPGMAVREWR